MIAFRTSILVAAGLLAGPAGGYWYAHVPARMSSVEPRSLRPRPSGESFVTETRAARLSNRLFQERSPTHANIFLSMKVRTFPSNRLPRRLSRVPRGGSSITETQWVCLIPRQRQKRIEWGWTTSPSTRAKSRTLKTASSLTSAKINRSGIRTETVEDRVISRQIRAVGTVNMSSRLTIVTMRSDGSIEDLFVNKTGHHVHIGEALFRVLEPRYSAGADRSFDRYSFGEAWQRRRGYQAEFRRRQAAFAQLSMSRRTRIREVVEKHANPRTLDWPAPASGDVIEKRVINGQRVKAGDELYRIVDHSHVWVIADVAEADLGLLKLGARATITWPATRSKICHRASCGCSSWTACASDGIGQPRKPSYLSWNERSRSPTHRRTRTWPWPRCLSGILGQIASIAPGHDRRAGSVAVMALADREDMEHPCLIRMGRSDAGSLCYRRPP